MLGVEPLDPQVTEFLSGVSTATLTAELFTHRLRNTFLSGVRSLNPAAARFVGDAFTLRYIPAREDLDVVDGSGASAAQSHREPQQRTSTRCGLSRRHGGRGARQYTRHQDDETWCCCTSNRWFCSRFTPDRQYGFPGLLCRRGRTAEPYDPSPRGFSAIGCGGVAVFPGDIIVGDEEGVVAIPRHIAPLIAESAVAQEQTTRTVLAEEDRARLSVAGDVPARRRDPGGLHEHRAQRP